MKKEQLNKIFQISFFLYLGYQNYAYSMNEDHESMSKSKNIVADKSIAKKSISEGEQDQQMNLITLNIWGGHIKKPLLKFVKKHSSTDIFCFQEVYHKSNYKISEDDNEVNLNVFSDFQYLLSGHKAYFRPVIADFYGIGIFVKKELDVLEEGYIFIHENFHYKGRGPTHSRILQWLKYRNQGQIYNILNVHGLWNGMGKTDSLERINQSRKIKEFMNTLEGPIILCGDLNLRPDTENIEIIEEGMNNLIKLYDVKSTRTSLYPKEERFADYIFSSPEIPVNSFEVLNDEVSDHCPLRLNFGAMNYNL